jgi:hypothetical protein
MDLIMLVLVVSIIGFLVWLITTKIPMDPTIRLVIQIAAVIIVVLYILTRLMHIPNVIQ